MSNIPKARRIISKILASYPYVTNHKLIYNLHQALRLMQRRTPKLVAKRTKVALTKLQIRKAKSWRKTGMHQSDIAARFNVNPGRISELGI